MLTAKGFLANTHSNTEMFLPDLSELAEKKFDAERYGDLPRWQESLDQLPDCKPSIIDLNQPAIIIGDSKDLPIDTPDDLHKNLMGLHPWRKGPFQFFGVDIDTEWRSDFKWYRIFPHINSLKNKTVLDVGCGSGYHCWRMRGAGAAQVIGIEPTPLFVMQFQAAQRYIQDDCVQVLPLRMEDLPSSLQAFDSTFSMGILYHRRSPMDHLLELKETLKPGGQLIIETLVIEGENGEILVPEGRYGKMGNVWFIPSTLTLESWLRKSGYQHVECINVSRTTTEEQRSTKWMTFQSLSDFLDPEDKSRTIEGHPAPLRATFIAHKPE